jgi:hypothetical protein
VVFPASSASPTLSTSLVMTAEVGRQVWSLVSSWTRTVAPVGSTSSAHHASSWNQTLLWFSVRVGAATISSLKEVST